MATLGRFDQFMEDGDEDFQSYVERFDHFLKPSQVSDDLKVSVFITAIGKKAYKTLKTLLEPEKPENKTYAQLVQTLKEQYVPKTSVIAERFKFNRCFQQDGQAVTAFAVELKRLATSCDFGTFLDDALRDRFVAGLCDKETQAELLKTSKLAFKEACDIARSIELARKESQDFQPKSAQGMISALNQDSGKRPPRWREETSGMPAGTRGAEPLHCFRCGSEHEASICKFRKYRCRVCKRVGHLAKMCRDRDNKWLLVLVDAHSKWVEVFVMNSTTTEKTVERLREVFASYGLPEEVVTDNGPQFTAKSFTEFLLKGLWVRSPSYEPPSPSGSCVCQVCYRTAGATLRLSSLGATKCKSTSRLCPGSVPSANSCVSSRCSLFDAVLVQENLPMRGALEQGSVNLHSLDNFCGAENATSTPAF
ncbi:uncharacterized protein LOC125757180 [Rhipicephalus sanguineus]|uniref:uncharacterized protein LOC125757180 n=1 Tax=Rhipicephalus sanguineus TaxID=34632 RepID=UPI0020C22F8E|nr:uncharacterized protein LOC125757180 [Rhipicephalus sanguineus]